MTYAVDTTVVHMTTPDQHAANRLHRAHLTSSCLDRTPSCVPRGVEQLPHPRPGMEVAAGRDTEAGTAVAMGAAHVEQARRVCTPQGRPPSRHR